MMNYKTKSQHQKYCHPMKFFTKNIPHSQTRHPKQNNKSKPIRNKNTSNNKKRSHSKTPSPSDKTPNQIQPINKYTHKSKSKCIKK